MNRIKQAILNWLAPSITLYVVTRTRDDKITDVEVYTDIEAASRRQQALGIGCTALSERGIDDPIWEQRHRMATRSRYALPQ